MKTLLNLGLLVICLSLVSCSREKGSGQNGGDTGTGAGSSSAQGFDTPDAALTAYGNALVEGNGAAYRKVAAKDTGAIKGLDAIIQFEKDKSPEEAARINLKALAPMQGFGDVPSKRFPAEVDGDSALIVQLFEREIAFKKEIHFRKFKFAKSGGKWFLVGSEFGEASKLPDMYAWNKGAETTVATSSDRKAEWFIPHDALAALIVHPQRAAASEIGQALLKLNVVQDGLQQSQMKPDDIERIIYTIGIPTEESENDCTVVHFAKPMSREIVLKEEFGDQPYEQVQFQGETYYRNADESATDQNDDFPAAANKQDAEAVAADTTTVLAKYPDDFRPDANGHTDSSGNGIWVYHSSETQNPTLPQANLRQLNWDTERKRYQSPLRGKNNTFPSIDERMHPSPDPPHFAVLRWQSSRSAAIRIRGKFSKLADAKDSNGVHVLVFVDGEQKFGKDVGPRDARGVDFDFAALVKLGSVVDFVVDPKADAYWDSTLLKATIERTSGRVAAKPDVVDTRPKPPADDGESATLSGTAIYFPDDKTIVSTDEQRLRGLLSGSASPTPLIVKLSQLDLEHDLVAVVAFDGYQDQAAGLLELVAEEIGLAEVAGLAAVPKHAKSAVVTIDLAGNRLLQLTLEAANEKSAGELHNEAKQVVGLLRGLRDVLPRDLADARPNPLLPLFDELVAGISVRQDVLKVLVDVPSPNRLSEFIENDMDTVVSSIASGGVEPRPDVSPRPEVNLFNGEDLSGWTYLPVKNSKHRTNQSWFVDKERKVLFCVEGDRNELSTAESFRDFDLKLQWRWRPGSEVSPNGSGVVVRGAGLIAKGSDPKGLEIDLRPEQDEKIGLGSGTFIAYNVSLANHRGTANGVENRILGWLRQPSPIVDGQWSDLHISCIEDRVTVTLNGVVVNEGLKLSAREGKIVLRNQNAGVEFRNISLTEIQPRPDESTKHESDSPTETPKAATYRPPPKDHPEFRDLAVESHDCRIFFPGKPEFTEQNVKITEGNVHVANFQGKTRRATYMFEIYTYPKAFVAKTGAEALLKQTRDNVVDAPNGGLISSHSKKHQDSPALDFVYYNPDTTGAGKGHCRIVMRGNRVYLLEVDGFKVPPTEITVFHDSLAPFELPSGSSPDAGLPPIVEKPQLPVPDQAARDKALQLVRELFEKEFRTAKTPTEKTALAESMIARATEVEAVAERYVLLDVARKMAAGAGGVNAALNAVTQLEEFEVDTLQLTSESLVDLSKATLTAETRVRVANEMLDAAELAAETDRYDFAVGLLQEAAAGARKARDLKLAKTATDRLDETTQLKSRHEETKPSLESLKVNPDDTAANQAAGEFYCLLKGHWETGLPFLAKGNDEKYKLPAEQDLANPKTTDEQMELADRWFELAGAAKGLAEKHLQLRAAFWYRRALPNLADLKKETVEKRLSEMKHVVEAAGPKIVFLVDVPMLGAEGVLINDDKGHFRDERLKGEKYPQVLWAHPQDKVPSHYAFTLKRKYSQLTGKAAINDVQSVDQAQKPQLFAIYGDKRLLWKSRPLQKKLDSDEFSVNVSNVGTLHFYVAGGGFGGHALWVDVVLEEKR